MRAVSTIPAGWRTSVATIFALAMVATWLACARDIPVAVLPPDGGSRRDAAPSDAPRCALELTDLVAEWATPNTIRWRWKTGGEYERFASYRFRLAPSERDLRDRTNAVVTFDEGNRAELGTISQIAPAAGGQLQAFFDARELASATSYVAQVEVLDNTGCLTASDMSAGRTQQSAPNVVTVFSETPVGYSIPASYRFTTGASYRGNGHYQGSVDCAVGESPCWLWARHSGLDLALAVIGADAFATSAFLELAVACDNGPVGYAGVRLSFGEDSGNDPFNDEAWGLRCDGAYELIQAPLRVFTKPLQSGRVLAPADLAAALFEAGVGGIFTHGTRVRVDEVAIRW